MASGCRDDDAYFFKRTRYFVVGSVVYWEHELARYNGKFVVGKRRFNTISEVQEASQRWDTGLAFQKTENSGSFEDKYTKSLLQSTLYYLYKNGSSTVQLGRRTITRKRLEEFLDLLEQDHDTAIYHSGDRLDVKAKEEKKGPASSAVTRSDTSPQKIGPAMNGLAVAKIEEEDELEGDELLHKIVDNLRSKMMAVKRYREVSREVRDLRVLLAEKEEDLKECERVVELESEQV